MLILTSGAQDCHIRHANELTEPHVVYSAGELNSDELERIVTIIQNPTQFKIPTWFLNRQRDIVDGKNSQILSNGVDSKIRDDLERLKKIRAHRGLRHYWGLRVRGQHTKTTGMFVFSSDRGDVADLILLLQVVAERLSVCRRSAARRLVTCSRNFDHVFICIQDVYNHDHAIVMLFISVREIRCSLIYTSGRKVENPDEISRTFPPCSFQRPALIRYYRSYIKYGVI